MDTKEISTSTSSLQFETKPKSEEKSTSTNPPAAAVHRETITESRPSIASGVQTEESELEEEKVLKRAKHPVEAECQTDSLGEEWLRQHQVYISSFWRLCDTIGTKKQ